MYIVEIIIHIDLLTHVSNKGMNESTKIHVKLNWK